MAEQPTTPVSSANGQPREATGTVPTPTPTPTPTTTTRQSAPASTRTGVIWTGVAVALVLFVLLIIFILQNLQSVTVNYFGLSGAIPLGIALLIAAVGGGIVVAIAGIARMTQLRFSARKTRRRTPNT